MKLKLLVVKDKMKSKYIEMTEFTEFNDRAIASGYKAGGRALVPSNRPGEKYKYSKPYAKYLISKKGIGVPQFRGMGYNPLGKTLKTQIQHIPSYFFHKKGLGSKPPTMKRKFKKAGLDYYWNGKDREMSDYRHNTLEPLMKKFVADEITTFDINLNDAHRDVDMILNQIPLNVDEHSNIEISFTDQKGNKVVRTLNQLNKVKVVEALNRIQMEEETTHDSFEDIVEQILNYTTLTVSKWSGCGLKNSKCLIVSDDDEPPPTPLPKPKQVIKKKKKKIIPSKKGKPKKKNGFYPYIVPNMPDELYELCGFERMGIFKSVKKVNYEENCLIKALRSYAKPEKVDKAVKNLNCVEKEVNKVHSAVMTQFVPNVKLHDVARMLKRNITLDDDRSHRSAEGEGNRRYKYPEDQRYSEKPTIALCSRKRHFFAQGYTPIHEYTIKNYDTIHNEDKFERIKGVVTRVGKGKWKRADPPQQLLSHVLDLVWEHHPEYFETIVINSELMGTAYFNRDDIDQNFTDLTPAETDLRECREPYIDNDGKEREGDYDELMAKHDAEDKYTNFYCDFETFTRGVQKHIPYLACGWAEDGRSASFHLKDMDDNKTIGYQLLNWCCNIASQKNKRCRIYFHNAKYDFRFIYNNLYGLKTIEPNGRFVCAWTDSFQGGFYNDKPAKKNTATGVSIKCSYNMIGFPLRDFSDLFPNITASKDVMPYDVYTPVNYEKQWISVKECCDCVRPKEMEQFLKNLDTIPNVTRGEDTTRELDIIAYADYYCLLDCETLFQGWNTFRNQILTITDNEEEDGIKSCATQIDINFINTSAKLAHTIMILSGVYHDVYSCSGVVQAFISRAKVGGKTMLGNNKKRRWSNRNIANSDANSLYPSAMARLPGYLKGHPKVITDDNLNHEFLSNQDGYFVEIAFDEDTVFHPRSFPLQAVKDPKTKVLNFTNNCNLWKYAPNAKGKRYLTVDNYALEDLINFHKVDKSKIKIIRGYYYNEGFNTQVGEIIRTLYATRIKFKDENNYNPIEKAYKLILNSAYGYSILKPVDSEVVIVKMGYDLDKYKLRWGDFIKSYSHTKEAKYARVEQIKPINEHFNYCVAGVQVLSMSKRIMNEVVCLADDIGAEMCYMDTDSIHFDGDKLDELETKYNNEHKGKHWFKGLYGDQLGQFSSDFEMKVKIDGKKVKLKSSKIRCRNGIYLGKKAYCEILEGHNTDKQWEDLETDDLHTEATIRMKGVSNGSMLNECNLSGRTELKLYEDLYGEDESGDYGKGQAFNLLKYEDDTDKPNFRFNSDYTITNNEVFERFVCFNPTERATRKMETKK